MESQPLGTLPAKGRAFAASIMPKQGITVILLKINITKKTKNSLTN
jgi:hypothetical protein